MLKVISNSEEETISFGRSLVRFLERGDIICLSGDLGAGKTVLVKGIASGLGINKDEVISPSFVLIREYSGGKQKKELIPLYHFDLYRLTDIKDIFNLGYEEYFYGNGISVIEWAKRMKGYLPSKLLNIEFVIKGKTKRILKLSAKGVRYRKIMHGIINSLGQK